MIRDLRDWLAQVRELGELLEVTQEMDWNEEMSALAYLVGKIKGGPALLFESVRGYPRGYRALFNLFGTSKNRIALTLGAKPGTSLRDLILLARDKFKQRVPPQVVPLRSASVAQNVVSDREIDLGLFPSPKFWPLDGGRYLGTWDLFITRDPGDGHVNLGTYRQMVRSKNEVHVYWSPGKDARLHAEKMWAKGEPLPVACAYGVDPALFTVSSQTIPKNLSEYDYAGGIRGEGIQVFEGEVTGLPIPAHAEIALEGIMHPGNQALEGPFGEFTGYYGRPEDNAPIIDVKRVYYRDDPILTCALMADYPSCDQNDLFSVFRSARIWDDLDALGVPGIRGVFSHPAAAGGFGMTIVSLEQRYAGHASEVAALAAQCPAGAYYCKWIVVVDEDVDPADMDQVIWAMSTRCDPSTDLDILRNTWSTWLDPTKNPPSQRPYGSKVLINACKDHRYLDVFSRRTKVRKQVLDDLRARWKSLGLPSDPPELLTWEE
ncbi:MAG: UbiD family decarboxylase [Acidobacteria bacterium]|nr:UbiD family decarboxylase [Acidobacteriota bacterium]